MRSLLAAATGFLIACGSVAAVSQSNPAQGEQFLFEAPGTFKIAKSTQQGGIRVVELIPQNETLHERTELIQLYTFLGWRQATPSQFVDHVVNVRFRSQCAKLDSEISPPRQEKGYTTVDASLTCWDATVPPGGPKVRRLEFLMMKVVQGGDSFYVLQRAWHSDTVPVPPPVADAAVLAEWRAFFAGAEICDRRIAGQPCGYGGASR